MKDMPVDQPAGLTLDCYLPREDVRDAFVAPGFAGGLADLPQGAVVGTSSLRRRRRWLHRRPDLQVVEFRGNVQTRLKKLADGVASCTFLAMAGLNRLGMRRGAPPPDRARRDAAGGRPGRDRDRTANRRCPHRAMLEAIHHRETGQRLAAERAFLAALDGSCETPIAGWPSLTATACGCAARSCAPMAAPAMPMP
jgi:hydroxymethylbilane synthase